MLFFLLNQSKIYPTYLHVINHQKKEEGSSFLPNQSIIKRFCLLFFLPNQSSFREKKKKKEEKKMTNHLINIINQSPEEETGGF